MKLQKVIANLNKAKERWEKKYPEHPNPEIFSFDEDEGILLCSKVEKDGGLRRANKPYLYIKSGLEKLL